MTGQRAPRSEEERLESQQGATRLLREDVTEEEIAEVVARWTGGPVPRLVEGEREKLLRLDDILHERVFGQDEAVRLVADGDELVVSWRNAESEDGARPEVATAAA